MRVGQVQIDGVPFDVWISEDGHAILEIGAVGFSVSLHMTPIQLREAATLLARATEMAEEKKTSLANAPTEPA